MRQYLIDSVGLAGLGVLAWGVYAVYPPAAFMVVGVVLMAWATLASRS